VSDHTIEAIHPRTVHPSRILTHTMAAVLLCLRLMAQIVGIKYIVTMISKVILKAPIEFDALRYCGCMCVLSNVF
jgi:hypothetical protein